jgi:uncharacterized tellurite resistance protein B-like protein
MSIFSKFLQPSQDPGLPEIKTEAEAFMVILYAVVTADQALFDSELDALIAVCKARGQFQDIDVEVQLDRVMEISADANGAVNLIRPAAARLTESHREAVFITALDLVLADGYIHNEEAVLLQELEQVLKIKSELADKARDIMKRKYL